MAKLKFEREMIKKAKEFGVQDVHIERTKDHPVLKGVVNGRPIRLLFAGASSSPRQQKSLFSTLRRLVNGSDTDA